MKSDVFTIEFENKNIPTIYWSLNNITFRALIAWMEDLKKYLSIISFNEFKISDLKGYFSSLYPEDVDFREWFLDKLIWYMKGKQYGIDIYFKSNDTHIGAMKKYVPIVLYLLTDMKIRDICIDATTSVNVVMRDINMAIIDLRSFLISTCYDFDKWVNLTDIRYNPYIGFSLFRLLVKQSASFELETAAQEMLNTSPYRDSKKDKPIVDDTDNEVRLTGPLQTQLNRALRLSNIIITREKRGTKNVVDIDSLPTYPDNINNFCSTLVDLTEYINTPSEFSLDSDRLQVLSEKLAMADKYDTKTVIDFVLKCCKDMLPIYEASISKSRYKTDSKSNISKKCARNMYIFLIYYLTLATKGQITQLTNCALCTVDDVINNFIRLDIATCFKSNLAHRISVQDRFILCNKYIPVDVTMNLLSDNICTMDQLMSIMRDMSPSEVLAKYKCKKSVLAIALESSGYIIE